MGKGFEYRACDRAFYEKELKNFLPPEFIDFHTHIGKKEFEIVGKSNGGSTWTEVLSEELLAEDLKKRAIITVLK